jgi:hypothetical protein
MYDAENNRLLQNAQLAQQAALASYEARNDINARNAAAANDAARLVYSTEADRLSQNAQLAQQAALASYEAQNDVAVRNAAAANDAARLMYSTEADRLQQNAQLAQQAALASYSAQNDWENNRANILNSFAMYNNDNAYNAAIAERAYRDALAQQGLEWAYDADKWNGQMAYNAAVQNADMWTTLQQLAWQRAAQLNDLVDAGGSGGGGGDKGGDKGGDVKVRAYYAPTGESLVAAPVADVTPNTVSKQSSWFSRVADLTKEAVKDGAATVPKKKTGKTLPPLEKAK